MKVWKAYRRALILRGVVVENDDWKKAVEEYRALIAQETNGGQIEEKDDFVVYVQRVCVGSMEDLDELEHDITNRSGPTTEAIEKAKATF
jgi:hypothetical protein